jgi:hypothetical protein
MALLRKKIKEKCIELFNKDHGSQHDQFIHSEKTYEFLMTTLTNDANFKYDHYSITYKYYSFVYGDLLRVSSFVVHDVEQEILRSIYKNIRNTKNTRWLARIAKLDSLTPLFGTPSGLQLEKAEYDLKFMRIFVQYALKKKLDDIDYAEYEKCITTHMKAKNWNTNASLLTEVAMYACVIS